MKTWKENIYWCLKIFILFLKQTISALSLGNVYNEHIFIFVETIGAWYLIVCCQAILYAKYSQGIVSSKFFNLEYKLKKDLKISKYWYWYSNYS